MADSEILKIETNFDYQRSTSRIRQISSSSGHDLEDECLDPQIQVELEKLNKGSDEINRLELELDDARSCFRQSLSDSTQKLNALMKKLGSCIEKARPYYDARMRAKEAQVETQRAALRFERAMSMHEAAKEMVQLAEQGYSNKGEPFDPAWQEMLNHATMKVNEAEKERIESEQEHGLTAKFYNESDQKVQLLHKDLKRVITKSSYSTRSSLLQLNNIVSQHALETLPYFEMKARFNQLMEEQKQFVAKLEAQVVGAKAMYSEALRNLERISDEIHFQRLEKRKHKELGIRGSGVGADSPPVVRRQNSGKVDGSDSESLSDVIHEECRIHSEVHIYKPSEAVRNDSYREAIDSSLSKSPIQNYNDNFQVTSMEEEYMSLPGSSQSKSHKGMTPEDDTVFSRSIDTVKELSSSPSSSTGSPSRTRKSKLQGIILKVDSNLDTDLRHPSFKPQRTQSMYSTAPSYFRSLSSSRARKSTRDSVISESVGTSETAVESVVNSPARKGMALELPRRGSALDMEDTSDTESIASTGPMMDDELVEMATLDLPNQSELEQEEIAFKRDTWKRRSLPPHLNYLTQYLNQESSDNDSVEETTNDDGRLTQEKLGLTQPPT